MRISHSDRMLRVCTAALLASLLTACEGSAYYRACSGDRECPASWMCGLDFCTAYCSRSTECQTRFGEGSYCTVGEWCAHECVTDEDCPTGARCAPEHAMCVPITDGGT